MSALSTTHLQLSVIIISIVCWLVAQLALSQGLWVVVGRQAQQARHEPLAQGVCEACLRH